MAELSEKKSYTEPLDAGDRVFRAATAEVSVKPGATWIRVRHRGSSVMMSLDEVEHIVAVLTVARDYAVSNRSARSPVFTGEKATTGIEPVD